MTRHSRAQSTEPAPPTNRVSRPADPLCLLAVVLTGVVLYARTLHVPWYLDDFEVITGNPGVHDLGTALRHLFARRGLALFSFALNWHLGGQDPVGFHLVNIAIHLATAGLVYLLLKRVFAGRSIYPLLGGLLFVAHPLQTQAVTYVVQRMTCLGGLLFFLALYLFVRARERLGAGVPFAAPAHLGFYFGALLCGALAVLAKESSLVLPLALLLFARYFPGKSARDWRPLLYYVAPFVLAPAALVVQAFIVPLLQGATLVGIAETNPQLRSSAPSPLHYLVTEFSVLWIYLRLLFLPWGQALDHDYPIVAALFSLKSALACAGLAGLGWLAWRLRQKRPLISFGIAWFFLTLAVESSIIPLDPLFEHRLYLPMFGFALVLPGLAELLPQAKLRPLLLGVVILVFAVLTWNRNALWNDPIAFYEDNLRQAPDNERLRNNLAQRYLHLGRTAEAEGLLRKALEINPSFIFTYLNLAKIYAAQGRFTQAEGLLLQAREIDPGLGVVYRQLGALYLQANEPQKALDPLSRALALDPRDAEALESLGVASAALQRWEEAERYNRLVIAAQPVNSTAHYHLGLALYNLGRPAEALEAFRTAVEQRPNYAAALFNAAAVALELGERTTAREMLVRLKAVNPGEAARLERELGAVGR